MDVGINSWNPSVWEYRWYVIRQFSPIIFLLGIALTNFFIVRKFFPQASKKKAACSSVLQVLLVFLAATVTDFLFPHPTINQFFYVVITALLAYGFLLLANKVLFKKRWPQIALFSVAFIIFLAITYALFVYVPDAIFDQFNNKALPEDFRPLKVGDDV